MNVDTVVAATRERVQAMLDDALDGNCKVPTDDDVARILTEEAVRQLSDAILGGAQRPVPTAYRIGDAPSGGGISGVVQIGP